MIAKRLFDLLVAISGLLILIPVFVVIAICVKLDSRGPVFFRQERVGQFGKSFRIHKFRTMTYGGNKQGLQLTAAGDGRITFVGKFLRTYKLDELPQLIDVVQGNMSLVGPRPEVPRYVAVYPHETKLFVLSVKPGITDFASIEFLHENEILAQPGDPEEIYINQVLPQKLAHCMRYVQERSLWLDTVLIIRTIKAIVATRQTVCTTGVGVVAEANKVIPMVASSFLALQKESNGTMDLSTRMGAPAVTLPVASLSIQETETEVNLY